MKLAFISDVHANLHALNAVLIALKRFSIDEIWCCGDIIGYNAFPQECLEIMREREIPSVIGNHEWATLTGDATWFNPYGVAGINYCRKKLSDIDLNFLREFPLEQEVKKDGVIFYFAHGSPRDTLFEYIFPWSSDNILRECAKKIDAEIIVLGHTHIPMKKTVNDITFLNPGSVGQPRDGDPKASFMVFNTINKTCKWYRIEYDIDGAAESIRANKLPSFLAERLYVGH